ncbi:MAG: N-acetyltransferase [Nanoarchaeota archaeon]
MVPEEISMYNFKLSSNLNLKTDLKIINQSDVIALADIDKKVYNISITSSNPLTEVMYFDEEDFREEIQNPTAYGFILYSVSQEKREGIGYIMGYSDTHNEEIPESIEHLNGQGSYLVSCAIAPCFKKAGIMTELMQCFEKMALIRRDSYIRLHTRTENNPGYEGASKFFQKRGFKITGIVKDYYQEGDDVYEMVKVINNSFQI